MKITNRHIQNFLVLLPLIMVYVGTVLLKVYPPGGRFIKLFVFGYMALYVLVSRKVDMKLFVFTLMFMPLLIWGILKSFHLQAGIEDGLRYMFPIVTLYYGYAIRDKFPLLLRFIIFLIIINFIAQLFNYYYWWKGEVQWFYPETVRGVKYINMVAGIMRATGLLVNFDLLAFLGLIGFILIYYYYDGKYKKWLLLITVFFIFASFSYKTIFTFLIVLFVLFYRRMLNVIIGLVIGAVLVTFMYPKHMQKMTQAVYFRVNSYLLMKKATVRGETYQLMWKELSHGNLFGKGVGMFGGPASLKYKSPYYDEVDFKWYDTFWMKMTTVDTFPPHVFIELGLIGGLLFFFLLSIPLLRRKVPVSVLLIYLALYFNMLFTFSMAAFEYMVLSLLLVYPIIYYHQSLKKDEKP